IESDSRPHTAGAVRLSHTRKLIATAGGSMGGLRKRFEKDEPALAIGARAAGQSRRERQAQRRNLPSLLGPTSVHDDAIRREQVVGGRVVAMLILHPPEDRKLVARAEMHLELARAVDDVIVDA